MWGLGRARGARVLLRIEDHDAQRSRQEYEHALIEDLAWLGFIPDEPPLTSFRAGLTEYRQSHRGRVYLAAAQQFESAALLYGCDCARTSPYPGTCRSRGLPLDDGVTWRLRIAPGEERFCDLLRGWKTQSPADEHGDIAIRDRLGNWTYQFVASVDDFVQDIDLVIRGEDLIASTGLQIAMARLMGRRTPATFAHHELVMKSPTQKLSKSDGDTGVRDLRAAGWTPARVIGEAARAVGLVEAGRDLEAREVETLFARWQDGGVPSLG